jgi:hypothetical protein
MNAKAKKTSPSTIKMHSASGRLTDEDYQRMMEMVKTLNTNVCEFVTSSILSTLDMIETDKVKVPHYVACCRFNISYENDPDVL